MAQARWIKEWKAAGPGRHASITIYRELPTMPLFDGPRDQAWHDEGFRGMPDMALQLQRTDQNITIRFSVDDPRALIELAEGDGGGPYWLDREHVMLGPPQYEYIVVRRDGKAARHHVSAVGGAGIPFR